MSTKTQLTTTVSLPPDAVTVEAGEPKTNSLKVAKHFGKKHYNVIQSIEKLLGYEEVVSRLNFQLAEYVDDQGKKRKMYEFGKDEFMMLTFGFTGAEAIRMKLGFITAFNHLSKIAAQVAFDTLESAHAAEVGRLIGTVQETQVENHTLKQQNRLLLQAQAHTEPKHQYGEISKRNGLPKLVYRQPTYAAQPTKKDVSIPEPMVIQLRLELFQEAMETGA